MRHISLYLTVLFLYMVITSCGNEAPTVQEFPIIETAEPSEIDESGVTLKGVVLQAGTSKSVTYGFLWDLKNPTLEESNIIEIGNVLKSGTFETRMDRSLVSGITYNIRAFATLENSKTIYGNQVSFESQGSAISPWLKLVERGSPLLSARTFGHETNQNGYAITYDGRLYKFNLSDTSFVSESVVPITISRTSFNNYFLTASQGETLYYCSNGFREVYKYENGQWSTIGQLPINLSRYGGHFMSMVISNELVILGFKESYAMDLTTKVWRELSDMPGRALPIVSTTLGDKAYMMTNDKEIWEYEISNDQWTSKTIFPGSILFEQPVTFSYDNSIYFGLNPGNGITTDEADGLLWSYNLATNEWQEEEPLPETNIAFHNFSINLNDKVYFINSNTSTGYDIWSFDPSLN